MQKEVKELGLKETVVELDWYGSQLRFSVGKMARQANAAVLLEGKGTSILAPVTMGANIEEDPGFFPLSVHFTEKFYASGKIPGGFLKREGKPSDKAVLTSRIIDRSLRPLFPEGFRNEVQIVPMTLSIGNQLQADILSTIASSAALYISDIPFNDPIGCVRIGYHDGKFEINPSLEEESHLQTLDLVVSANRKGIVMIEGSAKILPNDIMLEGLKLGYEACQPLIEAQEKLRKLCGKEKIKAVFFTKEEALLNLVHTFCKDRMKKILENHEKVIREKEMASLLVELKALIAKEHPDHPKWLSQAKEVMEDLEYDLVRERLFQTGIRVDGRDEFTIRPIDIEAGLFSHLHGSSLFTRGETQALGILTLGSLDDEQKMDPLEGSSTGKRYMLHYNFPSFSVGEVGKIGFTGRREVGHGYLAERSIAGVLPSVEEFPYTIRLVSEILESNGSSSMATICACILALMDGGVPIVAPVAGIAMGLMFSQDGSSYKILTDIQGIEDHYGDIDFKVAGTREGITGFQLDIKMEAVPLAVLGEALERSLAARVSILDRMDRVLSKPREALSEFAPRIATLLADPDSIKVLIGPGGKNIKKLVEDYGVKIFVSDNNVVQIAAPNAQKLQLAYDKIFEIVRTFSEGDILDGKVVRITNFGAFIQLGNSSKEGMCHISKISDKRITDINDVLKVGDSVRVKIIQIDKTGKIGLSIKDAKS